MTDTSPSYTSPIALWGVELDHNSSHLRGAAMGPAAIRAALRSGSANLTSENGIDIEAPGLLLDVGNLIVLKDASSHVAIREAAVSHLARGRRLVTLGGDHSITYPILQAHAALGIKPFILHFDAHPDLYDDFEGNPYSHASPFARIMEEGLAAGLTQVGIRTMNAHQRAQALRFGVVVHQARDFDVANVTVAGPVYVSIDLDALDPAFAPGVSHHEPGGLSVREILSVIQRIPGPIIGADIVELNPTRDINGMTAMVAAKLLKEVVGRMAETA